VYANPSAKSRIEFHKKLSTKFQGLWVMSDDEDASKSNLVCNGQAPKWQASGVEWTKEGAKFDGISFANFTLRNFPITDWSIGLTWLLRLSRKPSHYQYLLFNSDCSTDFGGHFAEYDSPGDLVWNSGSIYSDHVRFTAETLMTPDPNQFMNIGITAEPNKKVYQLYYNGNFVNSVTHASPTSKLTFSRQLSCFRFGSHPDSDGQFRGILRAVALANDRMNLTEINGVFDLIDSL
jgi:hypothetical protein